jgi:hypothetical protein
MDDRIDFGDRWWREIVEAIRASAAFVIVMTPESEESEWVEREILLAQREGKPIFPLLLRGQENPLLITTQYVDVTDGQMPSESFYRRLRREGTGLPPLLQKTSSYVLGMDDFDESFPIETEDSEPLGKCGMRISESLGEGTPRRVTAFEVWLSDKPNGRRVTKVLMSDFAEINEALRNKLSSRGEPVLAKRGGTFILETPALMAEARVVEMEYGEGRPAFGYFKSLKVVLTAQPRLT